MKTTLALLICLWMALPLQSQFYNNRERFEYFVPYDGGFYDDDAGYDRFVNPIGLRYKDIILDFVDPVVLNSYPEKSVEDIECECHYGSDWDSFLSTLDSYIEQQLHLFIAQKEKILTERIEEIMGSDYKHFADASFHFFRAINPANYKFDHQSSFMVEVNSNLNRASNERMKTYVNHKVIDALKKSIGRSKTDPLYHDFGDLELNGVRLNDISYVSWWTTLALSSMAHSYNNEYYYYKELKNAENNYFAITAISEYYRDRFMSHFNKLEDLDRIKLVTQYLIDYHSKHYSCGGCQPYGFYIPSYSYSKYEGVVKKHIVKLDRDFPDMSLENAKAIFAVEQMSDRVTYVVENTLYKPHRNSSEKIYLKDEVHEYLIDNRFSRGALDRIEGFIEDYDNSNPHAFNGTWCLNKDYQTSTSPQTIMKFDLNLPNWCGGVRFSYGGFAPILEYISNVAFPSADNRWYKSIEEKKIRNEGSQIRRFLDSSYIKINDTFTDYELGLLFDFKAINDDIFEIVFSEYAQNLIINYHHGDGIYDMSLFSDPLKIKALRDLLDGEEVDFEQASKPCPGDPLNNMEITSSGPSGKRGGTFGCTRIEENKTCDGIPDRKRHKGIDITAPKGTAVFATHSGKIIDIRNTFKSGEYKKYSFGNYVTIQTNINGNTRYIKYNHLDKVHVQKGKTIAVGDVIGLSGNTGNANDKEKKVIPHVDIQLFDTNWKPMDPIDLFFTKFDNQLNSIPKNCN